MTPEDTDLHLLVSALITAVATQDTRSAAQIVLDIMDLHPLSESKAIYLLAVHVAVAHARACALLDEVADSDLTPEDFRREIAEEIMDHCA